MKLGVNIDHIAVLREARQVNDPDILQGHVEETFIAHAKNDVIRSTGTSGGLVTALLISLLNNKTINGAVVAGSSPVSAVPGAGYRSDRQVCPGFQYGPVPWLAPWDQRPF